MKKNTCFICAIGIVTLLFLGCSSNEKNNPIKLTDRTIPTGMKLITGGTFQMGSNTGYKNEQPVHTVQLSSFFMDKTLVTQAEYKALMGVKPSYFTGDSLRPVDNITWYDALLYCNARSKQNKLDTVYSYDTIYGDYGNGCNNLDGLVIDFTKNGYRLPTEAEWEYACRSGTTTDYYWGRNYPIATGADSAALDSNAVWWYNSNGATARVGTKLPNAWGLYDMCGNSNEWCNDVYAAYDSGSQVNPKGPGYVFQSDPVMRGGSWRSNIDSYDLRSSVRGSMTANIRQNDFGFRTVLSL